MTRIIDEKMNIIFISPTPPPYMGPTIASEVILNSKLKDEFNLIPLDTSDHRELKTLGVIDLRNVLLVLKHSCLLVWLIVTRRPRIVYMPINQTTVGYLRDAIFIFIAKILGRKVVCHLRGGNFRNWYESASSATRWFVCRVHSLVDGQIVLGETLRSLFAGIVPNEKIFVVPNGGDFAADLETKRDQSKKVRLLYLSNFIKSKGVLDVLKAVPDIYDKYPDVEFVFAGNWFDENTRGEFSSFVKSFPKLPVVVRSGIHGVEKSRLFASSDVFVFPTYYAPEGQPWVIVESMAVGLPIITTNQGAIAESVIDGVNGFIVDKENPQQIAEKIKILIENTTLRKKMGEESRRLYMENFTERKMVERLSHAFNSVLERQCAE